jgi:hypothetical protein
MSRVILGPLYLLTKHAWESALCFLEMDHYLARFEVSPGWVLGRPAWPDGESRRKWVTSTQAMEVSAPDRNDETRNKLSEYELMSL